MIIPIGATIAGVSSLAKAGSVKLKANVTLTGGTNITLTQAGQDISIAASGGLSSKVIVSTRDMTAATGAVSYTGAGFTPTACIAWGSIAGQVDSISWGFADSAKTASRIEREAGAFYVGAQLFYIVPSGGNQQATVSTWDSDGVTLSWTKVSTPTGTADIVFLFLK